LKKLLVAQVILASIFLAGISGFTGCAGGNLTVHEPPPAGTVETADVKMKHAVDQAYAVHSAVTITLLQNYKDGVITKEQKDGYAVRTRQALTSLNTADDLIVTGDLSGAQSQLAIASAILTTLQAELAKYTTKQKQEKADGNSRDYSIVASSCPSRFHSLRYCS
jgi:hypothetical protein